MMIKSKIISYKKGFTLVELLVVVAIMGVLAAVGLVAYNGFMGNAKDNAAKTNQKNIASFVGATVTKCSIDGGNIELTGTTLSCSDVTAKNGQAVGQKFLEHFGTGGENWRNPHNNSEEAVHSGSSCNTAGRTHIYGEDGANGSVTICTQWGTESADKTSVTVSLE